MKDAGTETYFSNDSRDKASSLVTTTVGVITELWRKHGSTLLKMLQLKVTIITINYDVAW